MIKQVFGSFFRTIGRIIAYLAFGALIALIFQNKDVFALDSGYYQSTFDTYYIDCDTQFCGGTGDTLSQTGFLDIGSHTYIKPGYYTARVQIRTLAGATSNTWEANNTYTFRYTFNLTSSNWERIKNYKVSGLYANTSSSNSGSSNEYITSYTYKWEEGSVEGRYLLYVTFIPNTDIKYLSINLYMPNYNGYREPLDDAFDGDLQYSFLKVTYSEGSNAYIEYQTEIIQQQTDKINNSIKEMMDIFQQNADKQEDIYLNDTENEDGTCGGILCNLKKVVKGVINFPQTILTAIVDGLKALFIPSDFSFLDDFRNSIESKLGFIAEVPMAIIDFTLNLATASWDEFDSISFPEIEIFGYKFWNSQEIDLSEAIRIFAPFKYITDCLCVILCARTLNRWREKFTGGGD